MTSPQPDHDDALNILGRAFHHLREHPEHLRAYKRSLRMLDRATTKPSEPGAAARAWLLKEGIDVDQPGASQ